MPFSSVQTIRSALSRTRQFFLTGLWSAQIDALPKWKALPARFLRAVTVAVVEFFKDDCMLRASSLTFYTLLSIVPVCAVMFGVAKGFGFDKVLEKELMEQLAGQEQALERILDFSRKLLDLHGHAEHPGPVQAGPGRRHHLRNSFPDRPVGLHRVPGGGRQLQRRLRELCSPAAVLCLGADELDPGAVRRGAVLRVPERGHVLQRHGVPRTPTPREETAKDL